MSLKNPTLIFEEIGTGAILHRQETTFADYPKKVLSIKKSGKLEECRYIAYLQIESRMNHTDINFFKGKFKQQ